MTDLFKTPAAGEPALVRVIDFETTGTPEDEGAEVIELGRYDYDLATATIGNPWEGRASQQAQALRKFCFINWQKWHDTKENISTSPVAQ